MSEPQQGGAVVVGLGNPLMTDDGFGLAVLEHLRDRWSLPEGVELVDGGTWGMTLLPVIQDARQLLLLDAMNTGAAEGSVSVIEREALPRFLATKLSPHQIDLREVLAIAEFRGALPEDTVAMGAQPARVELGTGLTPALAARVEEVAALAVDRLRRWGYPCERVPVPAGRAQA